MREQAVLGGTGKTVVWESADRGLPLTTHSPRTPCPYTHHTYPMLAQTPHLDNAAPEEREVAVTMLCLPGIRALGVTDDDRLIEAGIEVKCQIS